MVGRALHMNHISRSKKICTRVHLPLFDSSCAFAGCTKVSARFLFLDGRTTSITCPLGPDRVLEGPGGHGVGDVGRLAAVVLVISFLAFGAPVSGVIFFRFAVCGCDVEGPIEGDRSGDFRRVVLPRKDLSVRVHATF